MKSGKDTNSKRPFSRSNKAQNVGLILFKYFFHQGFDSGVEPPFSTGFSGFSGSAEAATESPYKRASSSSMVGLAGKGARGLELLLGDVVDLGAEELDDLADV